MSHLSFPRKWESIQKMAYYVYILASGYNGTFYIGVTRDLVRRVFEHRNGFIEGFTKKYKVSILVYFEEYEEAQEAVLREKRLKKWNRQWKINLINSKNPEWRDLYKEIN